MQAKYLEHILSGRTVGGRYRLRAPTASPMGTAGSVLGKSSGTSLEFLDHRDYQPGDDLRMIDWSAFARSDRLVVKLYRQEFTPHLDILLDGSGSMALEGTNKAGGTMLLVAALATAAGNAGFTCCWRITGQVEELGGSGVDLLGWPDVEFAGTASASAWLKHGTMRWRPRSLRVFISDLLCLEDPASILRPMAAGAAGLFVVQLLARADADPLVMGNIQLVDCETGDIRQVYVDVPALEKYRRALWRHQQNWLRACRQVGASMATIIAEDLHAAAELTPLVEKELLEPA